ncbi:hypothetical protein [Brevundimonas sp.]|uniref:hypothetical protein n=1 Tax=Brevundimonas sp. TaxID=1871086 RepID=UPI0028A5D9F6|nr:hypothetical protein [Brevundimonas sp.]
MSIAGLTSLERGLKAQLIKQAPKKSGRLVALIEVIDEARLWDDALVDLPPLLAAVQFDTLMERFPLVGCAAAAEVGHRFEGIGTVFWARLEGLLGSAIPFGQRRLLATAYATVAKDFALQEPSNSGFANQFSIIAWPIANALMPYEMAGPIGRLLARGPQLGTTLGRRTDLSRLRAWAQAWEGARLTDWLQAEGPSSRVIQALMTDNARLAVPAASYARIAAAFQHHAAAAMALRAARRRKPETAAKAVVATEPGHLTLDRYGDDLVLSVSWPALPASIADQARAEAIARGWRPMLWGRVRTAAENLFRGVPIPIRLTETPSVETPTFSGLEDVLGDSPVVSSLLGRRVDWSAPAVFLADSDHAEQVQIPCAAKTGNLWILDYAGRCAAFPRLGEVLGAPVRELDLENADHRQFAVTQGWLTGGGKAMGPAVIRGPHDALTLPRGQISADGPLCLFDGETLRIQPTGKRRTDTHGLAVGTSRAEGPDTVGIFVFERETVFDALVEQRLLARLDGASPGARWPVEVMLQIDQEIIVYVREDVVDDGQGLGASSPIIEVLRAEHVRSRLLEAGRGTLRMRIGGHPWDVVPLKRQDGDIDWSLDDPGESLPREAREVAAPAPHPYRFQLTAPTAGAHVRTYQFEDGRLAAPALLEAPTKFGLGDLSSDFGPVEGRRRLRMNGEGLIDVARARRTWATARTASLAAAAARIRVVQQFERPLVIALCGQAWATLELQVPAYVPAGQLLFQAIAPHAVGDQVDHLMETDVLAFARTFSDHIDVACPDWADGGELDDEQADGALASAYAAILAEAQQQGRLLEVDPDDMDFGASGDQWAEAAEGVIKTRQGSPLVSLIAPGTGAKVLERRQFSNQGLAEASAFLAAWTTQWSLPRAQLDLDLACEALQFWLAPGLADPDSGALTIMSRDAFLARTVRYLSLRLRVQP